MIFNQRDLEVLVELLQNPETRDSILAARAAEANQELARSERLDYRRHLADMVFGVLITYVNHGDILTAVRLLGKPLPLLRTDDASGGWGEFILSPDGKLYYVGHKEGSTSTPRLITPQETGRLYAGLSYKLKEEMPPLTSVRQMLGREIDSNVDNYVRNAFVEIKKSAHPLPK